jgi:hypothetical protein
LLTINNIEVDEAGVGTTRTVCRIPNCVAQLQFLVNGETTSSGSWTIVAAPSFPATLTVNGTTGSYNINDNITNGTSNVNVDFQSSDLGQYVFRYTVNNAPCEDTADVTINVIDLPDAGQSSVASYCVNDASPVDIFSLLGGTPNNAGTWSVIPSVPNGAFTTNGSAASLDLSLLDGQLGGSGQRTYTFTYLVSSGNVVCLNCPNDSATVEITVTQDRCLGDNVVVDYCDFNGNSSLRSLLSAGSSCGPLETNEQWDIIGTPSPVATLGSGVGTISIPPIPPNGFYNLSFNDFSVNWTNTTKGTWVFRYRSGSLANPDEPCAPAGILTVNNRGVDVNIIDNGTTLTANVTSPCTGTLVYAWTGPNGFTASTQVITPPTSGFYQVEVYCDDDPTCTSTAFANFFLCEVTVAITQSGGQLFAVPSVPSGQTCTAVTYQWFEDGAPYATSQGITINNPNLTYTVVATCNGGTQATCTATNNFTCQIGVSINSTVDPTIFQAGPNGPNNCTGSITYEWTLPDMSTQSGFQITVGQSGTYTVTATCSTSGCTATDSFDYISPCQIGNATITQLPNDDLTVSIDGSCAGPLTYSWNTGATTQTITPTGPATYSVTVTCDGDPTCTASDSFTINCDFSVAVVASGGTLSVVPTGCPGGTPTYIWNTGFTGTSFDPPPGSSGQLYTVTGTCNGGSSNGCTDNANFTCETINVTISEVIIGQSAQLTANVTGTANPTYSWNTGATTQTITVTSDGNYFVIVEDANSGCENVGSINVVIPPPPDPCENICRYIGTSNLPVTSAVTDLVVDAVSLAGDPAFNFPYDYSLIVNVDQFLADLTSWLSANDPCGSAQTVSVERSPQGSRIVEIVVDTTLVFNSFSTGATTYNFTDNCSICNGEYEVCDYFVEIEPDNTTTIETFLVDGIEQLVGPTTFSGFLMAGNLINMQNTLNSINATGFYFDVSDATPGGTGCFNVGTQPRFLQVTRPLCNTFEIIFSSTGPGYAGLTGIGPNGEISRWTDVGVYTWSTNTGGWVLAHLNPDNFEANCLLNGTPGKQNCTTFGT